MGTSQSHPGPRPSSPVIPPWSDDDPKAPLPIIDPQRFKSFRQNIGKFIANGDQSSLKKGLGHYANKGAGVASNATRRLGSVTQAGSNLYQALSGGRNLAGLAVSTLNLQNLNGLTCEQAISEITEIIAPPGGDSDKIRIAMNHALVDALDGIEIFDAAHITNDVIVNTMINYLSESIFLQIVLDAGKNSWLKADDALQSLKAENDLRELIKVVVDTHMEPSFKSGNKNFSRDEILQVQKDVINKVWAEWENYI